MTKNYGNNISRVAIFFDIEKAFDTTWHSGILYKLHKLNILTNLIYLTGSILSEWKFSASVKGKISTPREIQARAPQGSVLSTISCSLYINDTPKRHLVFIWLYFTLTLVCVP
jgi:hypothetical protein